MQTCDFRYCHFQLAVAQAADNNGITNSKSAVTRKLSPCLAGQDILAFAVAMEGDPFVVGLLINTTSKGGVDPKTLLLFDTEIHLARHHTGTRPLCRSFGVVDSVPSFRQRYSSFVGLRLHHRSLFSP